MSIKNKYTYTFLVIIVTIMLVKVIIWDNQNNRWIIQDTYYKPDLHAKLTLAPEPVQSTDGKFRVYDATKINYGNSDQVLQPHSKQELVDIINRAKTEKKKLSFSGARHSSASQNIGDSIHLDMRYYDQVVDLDTKNDVVTVQSGISWKDLQDYLGKQGYAIKVMQDSNIFTVGGSIGTNVHGKDVRYGSLIQSVEEIKILLASGEEKTLSRDQNYDLFKMVNSGFGMFGVITEVKLKVEKDTNYQYFISYVSDNDLVNKFDEYQKDKNAEMVEGHFSIDNENFLKEIQLYYFVKSDTQSQDDVSGENNIWLRKAIYRISRLGDWGKQFRWFAQKNLSSSVEPQFSTRNTAMAAPFRTLELDDQQTTDILQEYFVPRDKVTTFLDTYRNTLKANNVNLINCVVRKVNQDQEATVSYATNEMYGFVCYYKIDKDMSKNTYFKTFTSQMIDYLLDINGKYYLAYDFFDNQASIKKMYPEIETLLKEKQMLDPDGIFSNKFVEKMK